MIGQLTALFAILISVGAFLTFAVYRFDIERLRRSGLLTKIVLWVPLAAIFLAVLAIGPIAGLVVGAIILVTAVFEARRALYNAPNQRVMVLGYLGLFVLGFAHLGWLRYLTLQPDAIVLPLIVGTVIADVGGFFFGQAGSHKLPASINAKKSWEGVAGELIGALIGVALIDRFITHQSLLWLALPIGIGAALGDLTNSRVKRILGIPNWAESIPGHGGVLDRFCSLAGSSLLTVYWLLVVGR